MVSLGSIFVLLALAYIYHINRVTREGMGFKDLVSKINPGSSGSKKNAITRADMKKNSLYESADGPFQPAKMTENPLYEGSVGGAAQNALERDYEQINDDPAHGYQEIGDDPHGEEQTLRDRNAVADFKNDPESPPSLPADRTNHAYDKPDNDVAHNTTGIGGVDVGGGVDVDGLPSTSPDSWSLSV